MIAHTPPRPRKSTAPGSDAWVAREIRELARAKRAGAIDHDGERAYLDRVAKSAYAYEAVHRG